MNMNKKLCLSILIISCLFFVAAYGDTNESLSLALVSSVSVFPSLAFNLNSSSGSGAIGSNYSGTIGGSDYGVEATVSTSSSQLAVVNTSFYASNPTNTSDYFLLPYGKYVNFSENVDNITDVIVKVFYSKAAVNALNLDEGSLRLEYFNDSSQTWTVFNPPEGGVDTIDEYVWANTTHLSIFGIFGLPPSPSLPPSSTGGGTSAGIVATAVETAINQTMQEVQSIVSVPLTIEAYQNEHETSEISITNTLATETEVKVSVTGNIAQFISFETTDFTLGPGESNNINIIINTEPNTPIGKYSGNIEIALGNMMTTVPVTIDVVNYGQKLLDIQLGQINENIQAGNDLPVTIELYNLGGAKEVDVQLTVRLWSQDLSKLLVSDITTLAVETSASVVRTLQIPANLNGEYVIRATVAYVDNNNVTQVAAAQQSITILPSFSSKTVTYIGIFIAIILGIIIILYMLKTLFGFANKFFFPQINSPLSITLDKNSINIKNRLWLSGKEITQIMAVVDFDMSPEKSELIYSNKRFDFSVFKGNVRDFFKKSLSSGPLMLQSGSKYIFVVKSNDCKFIDLFKNDECRLQFKGATIKKAKIYSGRKTHAFDMEAQKSMWSVLEPKYENNDITYFKKLFESLKKSNLPAEIDFKHYIKNIISILRQW